MDAGHFFQSKLIKTLIIILSIIIFFTLIIVISYPRIVKSVNDSKVIPLIKNHLQERDRIQKEVLLSLYFPIVSSLDSPHRYTDTSIMVKNDKYIVHQYIEELLKGVPQGALIEGATSFIPAKTTLIGYTVSKNIGYIHLSEEFLEDSVFEETYELRSEQLMKNMKENFSLKDIVIIIKDEILLL